MTSPWKACDIRGRYPDEVSPGLLFRIGNSLGSKLPSGSRVLIAGDFRSSTPLLKEALAEGLMQAGIRVLDAGQIPTPIAYFAHRHWSSDAVLIVTASHNPSNYNGLKLMVGQSPPTPFELECLRQLVQVGSIRQSRGQLEKIDASPSYVDWILGRWVMPLKSRALKVVLDAGNGAWSEIAPGIFEALGFQVQRLFCKIDGCFPNRPPDSARPRNLAGLSLAVRKCEAQLGIAWDGDGDRVAFSDETGSIVTADEMAVLLARQLLPGHAGAKVVYDIKLSDVLRRTIQDLEGIPIVERSGHTFIKRRMIAEDCLLGCEVSGHYFLQELQGGDDGLFTALLVSEMVGRAGSLHHLRQTVPLMYITPDVRLPAHSLSFQEMADRLRRCFNAGHESTLDGLRLETRDGFVLIRESVTEPAVTMRLEGLSKESLERMITICLNSFPEVSEEFKGQLSEK
jgi:phosphomannomutase/phosphoglucomutase